MVYLELLRQYLKNDIHMKNFSKILFIVFVVALIFASCKEPQETATKGYLKCYVDESLYNLIKTERDTFIALYPQSKIDLVKVTAREGIAAMLNGEAKLFISSRNLNDEEKSFFEKTKPSVRALKFCYDAVVPIVKENESAKQIKLDDLKKLLTGQLSNYKIFIPEKNSGVYEFVKTIMLENKEPVNVTVVKNENEVIDEVKSSKNILGLVGLNSLSGVKGVKILDVGRSLKGRDEEIVYYYPYVAYLVTENYPLQRLTTIIINDVGGVATGFATFLTFNKGQEIVAKNDLGPATVPVKMVQTNRR
jgi:phosphate transport system substrate-binding protein